LNAQPHPSQLISDEYRKEQEYLHETTAYGTASILYAPLVSQIVNKMQVTHLLDYGCGHMVNLAKHLKVTHKVTYQAYDPGVPRYSKEPLPAEMVACIDVLEHIEPDKLETVLDHIASLSEAIVFLSFDTGPALKTLSDGRNAHLIQQPIEWWLPKLMVRWDLQTVQASYDGGYYFVGVCKPRIESTDGVKIL